MIFILIFYFLNKPGSTIHPVKRKEEERVYYELYILIGIAGLILLALIAFVVYQNCKVEEN